MNSPPEDGHAPSARRKVVSREQLIQLIKTRAESQLHLGDAHVPIPIPIQPKNGETNWKIDVVAGVPSGLFDDYMAVIRELMNEYELGGASEFCDAVRFS